MSLSSPGFPRRRLPTNPRDPKTHPNPPTTIPLKSLRFPRRRLPRNPGDPKAHPNPPTTMPLRSPGFLLAHPPALRPRGAPELRINHPNRRKIETLEDAREQLMIHQQCPSGLQSFCWQKLRRPEEAINPSNKRLLRSPDFLFFLRGNPGDL